MPRILHFFTLILHLRVAASSAAATDTILAGQALAASDKLVSKNGRYALGFFKTSTSTKSSQHTATWYLGIWFNTVPTFTSAWVANREKPIRDAASLELTISQDGNLVIQNRSTKSIIWSTQANITTNSTTAVLLSSGNLVLASSANTSEVLWQSFDHPTDTFFPGAKLGWDKVTGLNRSFVSWKNSVDPAAGGYRYELDPSGVDQLLLVALNSSTIYWSTGAWNGKYFSSIPEMTARHSISAKFVDNDREKYLTYHLVEEYMDPNMLTRHAIDVSGQLKTFIWMKGSQDWVMISAQPKAQCDVYAVCGPFTICTDNVVPHCICMDGFTIASPKDWELEDRVDGCSRNTQLDCIRNISTTHTTDKFYHEPCVRLPQNAQDVETAASSSECAQICLNDCSCTAYSFGDSGCFGWTVGCEMAQRYAGAESDGIGDICLVLTSNTTRASGSSSFLPEAGEMATIPISGEGTVWGDRLSAPRRRDAASIPTSPPGLWIVNGSWQSGISRKRCEACPGSLCFVNGASHGQGESPLQEMDLQAASRV